MLKRGLIITLVILLISLLTYLNPSITSLGFLSFNKETDEITYTSDILDIDILNSQFTGSFRHIAKITMLGQAELFFHQYFFLQKGFL